MNARVLWDIVSRAKIEHSYLASSLKAAKFRYSRESSDFFSEIKKMDTIIKRENCLEDSKLAKQAMSVGREGLNIIRITCKK